MGGEEKNRASLDLVKWSVLTWDIALVHDKSRCIKIHLYMQNHGICCGGAYFFVLKR